MYCANSLSRLRLCVAHFNIIALWNITLGGCLDTRLDHLRHDVQPETTDNYIENPYQ